MTRRSSPAPAASALEEALRPLVERLVDERLAAIRAAAPDAYLSPRAAAELASVSLETIRRWVRDGRLPRRGTGRLVRIPRAALEKLLAAGPRRRAQNANASPEAMADRDFR